MSDPEERIVESAWKIIYRGGIKYNFDTQSVRIEIGKLLQLSPERLAHFFSGREIVLKKSLSKIEGERYYEFFEKKGLTVYLIFDEKELFLKAESSLLNTAGSTSTTKFIRQKPEGFFEKIFGQENREEYGQTPHQENKFEQAQRLRRSSALDSLHVLEDDSQALTPKFFSTDLFGRFGRLNYLHICLILLLTYSILHFIFVVAGFNLDSLPLKLSDLDKYKLWVKELGSLETIFYAFSMLISIFVGIFFLRATILRLHDLNRSGWWVIPVVIVLLVTSYFGGTSGYWVVVLLLACFPGAKKVNSYGRFAQQSAIGNILMTFSIIVIFNALTYVYQVHGSIPFLDKVIKTLEINK